MAATESIIISTPQDVLDNMNSWYSPFSGSGVILVKILSKVCQAAWRVGVDQGLPGKSDQHERSRGHGDEGEERTTS